MITDHLSILEMIDGKEKRTELSENFLDEQRFSFLVQTPWYADIANY